MRLKIFLKRIFKEYMFDSDNMIAIYNLTVDDYTITATLDVDKTSKIYGLIKDESDRDLLSEQFGFIDFSTKIVTEDSFIVLFKVNILELLDFSINNNIYDDFSKCGLDIPQHIMDKYGWYFDGKELGLL